MLRARASVARNPYDARRGPLSVLVKLLDLEYALARLPMEYYGPVLLHGLIGFSQFETARLLQVSQQAVSKRYRYGIAEAHFLMNGGIDY